MREGPWRRSVFVNRTAAGRALAEALEPRVVRPCVVGAIPRGGVSVALPVVERLGLPLAVVYARKLTAPLDPELAIGALDEDGEAIVDAATVAALRLSPLQVQRAKERVGMAIRERMDRYGAPSLARYLPDAGIVLIDDGLATGLTMRAAVAYARRHGARDIIVAVPCASPRSVRQFEAEADGVVSLVTDETFMAVGQYYLDFSPVSDDEVRALLTRANAIAESP